MQGGRWTRITRSQFTYEREALAGLGRWRHRAAADRGAPGAGAEAFGPAVRDDLAEFFHQALHRDHWRRFGSLKLDRLLAEAGFELRWDRGHYLPPPPRAGSSSMSVIQRRPSATNAPSRWAVESPELAAAMRAEERLTGARSASGFRALTVRLSRYAPAREELARRFGARPVNVAAVFLRELRGLVDAKPRPTWETVVAADIAEPGSRGAIKLGEYVEQAWQLAVPALRARLSADAGPVLLHDAAVLARYRAMERLYDLADAARAGAGDVWLLCPMEDPATLPKLDGEVVRVGDNEWIALPDAWVVNAHRSAVVAS